MTWRDHRPENRLWVHPNSIIGGREKLHEIVLAFNVDLGNPKITLDISGDGEWCFLLDYLSIEERKILAGFIKESTRS